MWHVAWRCRMLSLFNLHLNLKHCYKRGPCTSTPADIVYVHSEWGQVTVTLQEDTTNFVLMQFCLFLLLVLQLSPSVLFHLSEIFCTEASRYRRDPCFSFFFLLRRSDFYNWGRNEVGVDACFVSRCTRVVFLIFKQYF